MLKDTKSLGNNKAPACESRGFVRKKREVRILTQPLSDNVLTLSFTHYEHIALDVKTI